MVVTAWAPTEEGIWPPASEFFEKLKLKKEEKNTQNINNSE
jgi:hypothetical protein